MTTAIQIGHDDFFCSLMPGSLPRARRRGETNLGDWSLSVLLWFQCEWFLRHELKAVWRDAAVDQTLHP